MNLVMAKIKNPTEGGGQMEEKRNRPIFAADMGEYNFFRQKLELRTFMQNEIIGFLTAELAMVSRLQGYTVEILHFYPHSKRG